MAELKPNEFYGEEFRPGVGKVPVRWHAARREVLPIIKTVSDHSWGVHAEFEGMEAELLAAGIATPEMFEGGGPRTQRTHYIVGGDRAILMRRRGKWALVIKTRKGTEDGLPTDEHPRKCDWWKKRCEATETAVAQILARFARR